MQMLIQLLGYLNIYHTKQLEIMIFQTFASRIFLKLDLFKFQLNTPDVENKEEVAKYRTLGDTLGDWGVLELDLLMLMNWWRYDLNQGSAGDVEGGLKVGEEDGIKGSTEVKEDKDVERVILREEEKVLCDFDQGGDCAVMISESGLKWFVVDWRPGGF